MKKLAYFAFKGNYENKYMHPSMPPFFMQCAMCTEVGLVLFHAWIIERDAHPTLHFLEQRAEVVVRLDELD